MIQQQSTLKIIDNSGAKNAKCIKVLKKKSIAKVGDLIVVSITKVKNFPNKISKIKKGSIFLAVVVGLKTTYHKNKGITIITNSNLICLLNKNYFLKISFLK